MRPHKQPIIYLDNNASTPLSPAVATTMATCIRTIFGNPSSTHSYGKKARGAVEHARKQVAFLINSSPDEIVFTSGGTEANNMAILGTALRFKSGHIISSCIEHPSVMKPLKYLETLGFKVTYLPVDKYGIVSPDSVSKLIRKDTILVTIMHSNNETGSIQPIHRIGNISRNRGIVFHCDAAQSVGKVPVNAKRLEVDILTIVPHKFYGPKGVGALFIRRGVVVKPLMYGASHEKGLRPGTENVCSIAGLGTAAELAGREMKERVTSMRDLSRYFLKELLKQIPVIKLNGHPSKRLPNTLNLSFPGVHGSVLLDRLKNRIAASTGSACHEGKQTPSSVLKAMGLNDDEALSAIRLSLGRNTTKPQIRNAVKSITETYRSL